MSTKLPRIQNTDDFQSYIGKVNAVIDTVNNGELSQFIGDRELICFDSVSNMVKREDLVVGDVCMIFESNIVKLYKIVSSASEFDIALYTYYRLANGWWCGTSTLRKFHKLVGPPTISKSIIGV